MATPNIVPRADSEGGLGTAAKYWGSAYIDTINATVIQSPLTDGDLILKADNGSGVLTEYFRLDGGATQIVASKDIYVLDNIKLRAGNAGDLSMFHNATNSFIQNETGNLTIVNYADDGDIVFQSDSGNGGVATYFLLDGGLAAHNGSVTTALYTNWPDNSYISLGAGHDLQLVHTGVNSVIQSLVGKLQIMSLSGDLEFTQFGDDKDIIFSSDDGNGGTATYFLLDGSSATHDGSATTALHTNWPDNSHITLGTSNDFHMYHTGTQTVISQQGTGNLVIQNTVNDADISFSSDDGSGGTTAYLTLDGELGYMTAAKSLRFSDSVSAFFGASNDLIIQHDGSNSYINNGTGDLYIRQNTDDKDIIFQSDDGSGGIATYFSLDGSAATHDGSATTALHTTWPDKSQVNFGSGRDTMLYHDGSNMTMYNFTGDLSFYNGQDDGDIKFFCDDGNGGTATYFSLDGGEATYDSSTSATTALFTIFPDKSRAAFGTGKDLQISHDGANSYVENITNDLVFINYANDGDVIFKASTGTDAAATYLTLDGSEGLNVFSKSLRVPNNGNIYAAGSGDLYLGNTSSGIVKIGGDGDNSTISSAFNHLLIQTTRDEDDIIIKGGDDADVYITLDCGDISTTINTIKVLMPNLPTSASGLATGQLYSDSGTLKIA